MYSLFKNPDNLALVSQLKQKLNTHRDRNWTTYVNEVSRVYQLPQKKIEDANKAQHSATYDRKFLLVRSQMEKIEHETLQENYGYVLDPETNKVYLIIPTTSIMFEEVNNEQNAERIRSIILQKNDAIREATWEEMDGILDILNGDQPELSTETPEFLLSKKSRSHRGDGKFRSATHAPSAYAFKRYVLNCFVAQMVVEKKYRELVEQKNRNLDQEKAKVLLSLSWFSRSKENFSWSPLVDGIVGHSSRSEVILNATPNLDRNNRIAALVMNIENAFNNEAPNFLEIKTNLAELKTILVFEERNNIFIELFLALAGIVAAPIALIIGLIWLVPAYFLSLPYMGKPQFFLDTLQWFGDSLINVVSCLLFPIAMIQAYNTSGSMNVLKGECTRIVETLLSRVESESSVLSIGSDTVHQSPLTLMSNR